MTRSDTLGVGELMTKKRLALMSVFLIILSFQNRALATALQLTVATDKPLYDLGYPITVGGNLTLNGDPVSDGLVTVEIDNPKGQMIVVETLTTGTEPPKPWTFEITHLFTCDASGNPKTSVNPGGNIGFKVTLKNNDMSTHSVKVAVCVQYSNGVPSTAFVAFDVNIEGNSTQSFISYPLLIDSTAPLGVTYLYASAVTALPTKGGFAYCPEAQTTFLITSSSGGGLTTNESIFASTMSSQAYSLVLGVSSHGGVLGNYTIYTISKYSFYVASSNAKFNATLITDITGGPGGNPDGIVDVSDVSFVVSCYGSYPGHGHWDPRADINKDGIIDVADVALVAGDFGKWGVP
jgi:hypothetical protein